MRMNKHSFQQMREIYNLLMKNLLVDYKIRQKIHINKRNF